MSKKNIDIEQYEQDILEDLENGKFVSTKNAKEEMLQAKEAARHFMRRDSRVNIRVSSTDLNIIRRIAVQEGLPYQTLLASVVHKFAAGRLADRNNFSDADDR